MRKSFYSLLHKVFVSFFLISYTFIPSVEAIDSLAQDIDVNVSSVIIDEVQGDILDEGISDPEYIAKDIPELWIREGLDAKTSSPVLLGERYLAPQNDSVSVTFTKLPDISGYLSITKIYLTEQEVLASGAVSNIAYDISTDMVNGTFEYDLTLPSFSENASVGYAEERNTIKNGLNDLGGVVENGVIYVNGLDHFTVFVVTNDEPPLSGSVCIQAGASTEDNCYNTIQEAIDNSNPSGGDTILVKSGLYEVTESISVWNSVQILGIPTDNVLPKIVTKSQNTPAFKITTSDVSIKNFEITTDLAPFGTVANEAQSSLILIQGNNIVIENNILYSNEYSVGGLGTWTTRGIVLNTGSATISNNIIHSIRNGIVTHSNTTASINNNNIFNTKGGIMNYTLNQADANNRTMSDNTWVSTLSGLTDHNEWDIVWNSGGGYVPILGYNEVVPLSELNNGAYVLDRRANDQNGLVGNRSHIFVKAGSTHNSSHAAKGNFNEPFSSINLGIEAVAQGGTIIVGDGVYSPIILDKEINLVNGSSPVINCGGSGNGILIKAPNINIDGFEITNCTIGIRSYGGPANYNNLTIKNVYSHHNTQNGVLLVNDTFDTVTLENLFITENGQNGIGLSNSLNINNLFIRTISSSSNNGHGMFIANASIDNLDISGSSFNSSKTNGFSGITIGTTASNIDHLNIENSQFNSNKGSGLSIVQASSIFNNITAQNSEFKQNSENGFITGGGSTTENFIVENSIFENNGWEDLDIGGGWFGAFNVNNSAEVIKNNFYPSAWAKIYVGDLGNINSLKINFNNFNGSETAIYNSNSIAPDVNLNWWNSQSGPSGRITGNSEYKNWLCEPYNTNKVSFNGSCTLESPETLGWNIKNSSSDNFSSPRPPELQCGLSTNINAISAHWTDKSYGDTNIKYERQFRFDLGSGWTSWAGSEIYSNPYSNFRTFGSSVGNEGIYDSRVRTFYDYNQNGKADINELFSDWSEGCSITFDRTAPLAPEIVFPNEGQYFNSQPILNDWTEVNDISGISQYRIEYKYDDGHTFSNAPYRTTTNSQRNHTPSPSEEGGVKFRVQAFDNAGNEGQWSEWRHYFYDSSAPSIPTNLRFENPNIQCNGITNSFTSTAKWDISEDKVSGVKEYRYFVDTPIVKGWTTTRTSNSYPGAFNQGDGEYTFKVKAIDNVGFQSDWSDTCTVTYDSTAPQGSIDYIFYNVGTGHFVDHFITNSNSPILSGTYSDNYRVENINIELAGFTHDVTFDSGEWKSLPLGPIPSDGTYIATLTLTDTAGNITTITKEITIDTKAPNAVHSYFRNGVLTTSKSFVKGVNELTFTGEYSDTNPSSGLYQDSFVIFQAQNDGSFKFSQDGKKAYCAWRKTPNLVDLNLYTGQQISFTDCVNTLPDGNYFMAHQIYDNATRKDIPSINQFRDVLGLNFVVDTIAPVTTFLNNYSGTIFNGDIFIEGISTDQNNIKSVFLEYKKSSDSAWEGITEMSIWENSPSYEWSTLWGPTEDGIYDIKAYAVDFAGNVENSAYMSNITFDRTNPSVGGIKISFDYLGMYVNGNTGFMITAPVSDSLSGIDKDTCMYTLDNGTWYSGLYVKSAKTCMFTTPTISDNQILNINVKVTDKAGNTQLGEMLTRVSDSRLPTGSTLIEDNFYGPNGNSLDILGTANDSVSGVKDVKITIRRSSDNRYWNNLPSIFNWTKTPLNMHNTSGTDNWSYNGKLPVLQNGVTYTITPYIWDYVHLTPAIGSSDSFSWDNQPPTNPEITSSHQIDSYSSDSDVDIFLENSHDFGLSGVHGFYFSFSNTPEDPGDINFLPSSTESLEDWDLTEGEWYFNIKTKDKVGNISGYTSYGPIFIDTTPPTLSQIPSMELIEGDTLYPVNVEITDTYGVSEICLNVPEYPYEMCDNTIPSDTTEYNMIKLVTDKLGITTVDTSILPVGLHTLEYYAYDLAGNKSLVMLLNVEILKNIPTVEILGLTNTTVGTPITLSANITDGNAPYTYAWTGDCTGTSSTSSFTPLEERIYTCTVTVTDVDEDTASQIHTVNVGAVQGARTTSTDTQDTSSSSRIYSYNTSSSSETLGTGGPDEEISDSEAQEDENENEEVKGTEDDGENEDNKDTRLKWYMYILFSLPVLLLIFLVAKRRKEEEESKY